YAGDGYVIGVESGDPSEYLRMTESRLRMTESRLRMTESRLRMTQSEFHGWSSLSQSSRGLGGGLGGGGFYGGEEVFETIGEEGGGGGGCVDGEFAGGVVGSGEVGAGGEKEREGEHVEE